jgi:hypothetical protein
MVADGRALNPGGPVTITPVRRELLVFTLVVFALVGATTACGASTASPEPQSSAVAEATNVRRTAIAAVQIIIANNPAATSTTVPTATAGPTCQGAIWWREARSHIGESRTVQGPVVGSRPAPNATTLLELGQAYPDPTGFMVLAPGAIDTTLMGKTVCVVGKIVALEGMPTMQLQNASAVVVVAAAP